MEKSSKSEYTEHLGESLHDDFVKLDKLEHEHEVDKKVSKKTDDNQWEKALEKTKFNIR